MIRDSVAKVKLPPDLVAGDSRAGVSRGDLPKFSIIQKSTPYHETVLKLLSTCDLADAAVNHISVVSLAHLRFLQEDYMQPLVSSQFDNGTAKLFCTSSSRTRPPSRRTPSRSCREPSQSLLVLGGSGRAVSIAGARQNLPSGQFISWAWIVPSLARQPRAWSRGPLQPTAKDFSFLVWSFF